MTLRIVIADDHPMFREGLSALLNAQADLFVIAAVDGGNAAVDTVKALDPDVAVLDLSMPDGDGYAASRSIAAVAPRTRILLLTSHDTHGEIAAAFAAGGHGFLLKSATPEEIVDAVRAVGSGTAVMSDAVLASLRSVSGGPAAGTTAFPELTARELQVLEQLASGASNDAIARTLHLSAKTVRNYLSTIFMKLDVGDRTAAAVEARRRGLGQRPD